MSKEIIGYIVIYKNRPFRRKGVWIDEFKVSTNIDYKRDHSFEVFVTKRKARTYVKTQLLGKDDPEIKILKVHLLPLRKDQKN